MQQAQLKLRKASCKHPSCHHLQLGKLVFVGSMLRSVSPGARNRGSEKKKAMSARHRASQKIHNSPIDFLLEHPGDLFGTSRPHDSPIFTSCRPIYLYPYLFNTVFGTSQTLCAGLLPMVIASDIFMLLMKVVLSKDSGAESRKESLLCQSSVMRSKHKQRETSRISHQDLQTS